MHLEIKLIDAVIVAVFVFVACFIVGVLMDTTIAQRLVCSYTSSNDFGYTMCRIGQTFSE